MNAETVFRIGEKLTARLKRDYPIMLENVQRVVQNDYGWTPEVRHANVNEVLVFLDNMTTQLNNEIAEYRKALESHKDQ